MRQEADAGTEFIDVSFAAPTRADAIDVVETYNPGALTRVELA